MVLLLVFPEGRLLSQQFRPALWAALAFIPLAVASFAFYPQDLGPLSATGTTRTLFPGSTGSSRRAGPGHRVRCRRRGGRGGQLDAALAPADRVGRQQLVAPGHAAFTIVSLIATLVFPGTWSLALALPAAS